MKMTRLQELELELEELQEELQEAHKIGDKGLIFYYLDEIEGIKIKIHECKKENEPLYY